MQWRVGPFRLDLDNACLWQGDERLVLRPKTFDVLTYLVEHAGELVTKDDLLAAIWPETVVAESTLTVSMSELRKVLGETARTPQFIATVHRRGYRLIAPVTALDHPQSSPQSSKSLDDSASSYARELSHPLPARLFDREGEFAQLHQRLTAAQDGQRQVLFVTGEAGIGKTALVDAFVHEVRQAHNVYVSRGQCIDQYGAGEAYLPLLEALGLLLHDPQGADLVTLLKQQAPSWLLQLPAFVPEAEFDLLQRRASGVTRERMLRELAELMETLTAVRPLVLVLEDLHWSDTSTLDWLAYVARRRQPARLLILGTYRPVDAVVSHHRVRAVTQELSVHGYGMELALDYLSQAGVAAYLRQRLQSESLPDALVQRLYQRTNGNPLFLRTMVDALEQQGVLRIGTRVEELGGELNALEGEIPGGIQQLIAQQLERLTPSEQEILEAASVAGKEFVTEAVAACLGDDPERIESQCATWARRGQFVQSCGVDQWPDGTVSARFAFIHDLYREVAYARIPVSRQVRWHQRVGARLEAGYGAQAREIAAELAGHFVQGRNDRLAVVYLIYAGEQALQRHANQETIAHFTQALELLPRLPDTSVRKQQELSLQVGLGVVFGATKGFGAPEVEQAYVRARELCQQLEDVQSLFPVLYGLVNFYQLRANIPTASRVAEQLFALAQRANDTTLLMQGHNVLSQTRFFRGESIHARTHFEQTLALYDVHQHHGLLLHYGEDPGVLGHYFSSLALWHLGYPDQALQHADEMQALADELDHPFSVAQSLFFGTFVRLFRREWMAVQARTERLIAMCHEHGFAHRLTGGMIQRGWALSAQGRHAEGIQRMHDGLCAYRATGAALLCPTFLVALAEAFGQNGQIQMGLHTLAEAQDAINKTWECWWEAEVYRSQGEMLLSQAIAQVSQAKTCFHQALDVARRQQAKSLELRAAISLSRLWQQQGKQKDAHDLLASVYNWFTEGFGTADLQEAKTLLEKLEAQAR